ncbi:serine protease HTRA2, mitochondrial-like [Ptychodera flava]|uniref:serine protease HTRA2, mitochondrial-like n=1 Tax=Ptychodera flava TaxID=63121 RepID=UPI003969C98A
MALSRLSSTLSFARHFHRSSQSVFRLTSPKYGPGSANGILVRNITKSQRDKNIKIYWTTIGQFVFWCFVGYMIVGPIQRWFTFGNVSRRERKRRELREKEASQQQSENEGALALQSDFGRTESSPSTDGILSLPSVKAAQVVHDGPSPPLPPLRSKQLNFIADTVENVLPALVYIEIHDRHPFFGQDVPTSNGSGFIVSPNGLILTNAHVVANRKTVKVKLQDGRVFDGRVKAIDPVSDLAAIQLDVKDVLPSMKLGTSSELRPGEFVIAMGSPLALSNTITCGIVSTASRGSKELGLRNKDMNYIQTDAAINFGNSGGPLVNLDGEAIGINTMKVTAGISFAIPIDHAKEFLVRVEKLEREKSQPKGWFGGGGQDDAKKISITPKRHYIGLTMLTLTPGIVCELQQRMDNFPDVKSGVLIHSVVLQSPSHSAGIRPGDVIININGNAVNSASDVFDAVSKNKTLDVTIIRKDAKIKVKITPEEVD